MYYLIGSLVIIALYLIVILDAHFHNDYGINSPNSKSLPNSGKWKKYNVHYDVIVIMQKILLALIIVHYNEQY